eukprot:SAG31_NODE_20062_length_584_cov_3.865979_1_plen_159_part_10
MIFGGIFLFVLMFQPVAEGSALVSQAASVSKTEDQQPNLDLSQLAQLDIDPVLLQFIGNVVTELKEVKNDNMALQNRTQSLETENQAVRSEWARVKNRTQVLETKLEQVTKDKSVLENNTQLIEAQNTALKKRVTSLESIVVELSKATTTDSHLLKAKV